MLRLSTFSIVAYDPNEQAWGIAVASKFLAAGAVVPWAQAGAGAVATQSYANTAYGPDGLALMRGGASAQEALESLLEDDPGREQRQVGMVDRDGGAATFTGSECHDWAGGLTGQNFAVQGNILIGPDVVDAMANAFVEAEGDLPHRLFQALLVGDRTGGDRRGRQSAAIVVVKPEGGYAGFNDRWVDYRVDNDEDPLARLGEILELHNLYFKESPPEDRIPLQGEDLMQLKRIMTNRGYYHGEIDGEWDTETRHALEAFTGNENFEERTHLDEGKIDRPVFDYLVRTYLNTR